MGWAVGYRGGRWIGYGVPAKCDDGCGADIDRGLSYLCGGGIDGENGCGMFFKRSHLQYVAIKDGEIFDEGLVDDYDELEQMELNGEIEYVLVCYRCAAGELPGTPTPDTQEWALHVLNDESWADWRSDNPDGVRAYEKLVESADA